MVVGKGAFTGYSNRMVDDVRGAKDRWWFGIKEVNTRTPLVLTRPLLKEGILIPSVCFSITLSRHYSLDV